MQWIGLPDVWDAREADHGFMASLATFSFVALGLELVVDGTYLTLTGDAPSLYPLGWQCLTWVGLGAVWLLLARALVLWCRRRGLDPLPPDRPAGERADGPDHRAWRAVLGYFAAAVVTAIALPAVVGLPWGFAPVDRFLDLYAQYGDGAWLAMAAWLVYLVGRCLVVAGLLAYSHRAVLGVATFRGARWIPWGGLVTGVCLGTVALVSRGQAAGLSTLVASVLLGMLHVRSGESLRVTAPFTVLVYALV